MWTNSGVHNRPLTSLKFSNLREPLSYFSLLKTFLIDLGINFFPLFNQETDSGLDLGRRVSFEKGRTQHLLGGLSRT